MRIFEIKIILTGQSKLLSLAEGGSVFSCKFCIFSAAIGERKKEYILRERGRESDQQYCTDVGILKNKF